MEAYPLVMQPHFRNYIWGGRRLESELGKTLPDSGVWAESWEIVDHHEHCSQVANGALAGRSLSEIAMAEPGWLYGPSLVHLSGLPLLLKYLDCQRVLSVQVHPDDAQARSLSPPDLGKTEAWYILDAEPGAVLYAGLAAGVTRPHLEQALDQGQVESCLHKIQPEAGDCVFIPAGTVHALGAGLLVAEIQQASNTTYRLFDWNRLGHDGQPRALHRQQALEVIHFEAGPRSVQRPLSTSQPGRQRLVACDKFVLDRLSGVDRVRLESGNVFHLLTVPRGSVDLEWTDSTGASQTHHLPRGQSVLLPAALPPVEARLTSSAVLLDMYLPRP